MQFMVLLTRDPDKPAAPPSLQEQEFETVRGFYKDGLLRQVWYRGDTRGACMIWEAASPEEVAAKLSSLPLMRAGFLQAPMIVPLNAYPGFGPRA